VSRVRRFVLATANPDKAAEMRAIVAEAVPDAELVLRPRPPEVPDVAEDAPDLVGNARLKADAIHAASGLAAVADDTGLEVDALGGAPGVHSARFAGDDATDADNVTKLLRLLDGVEDRRARFRTVAYVAHDGGAVVAEGVCEGVIVTEPRGAGGFGYDPVFAPTDGDGRTFAEMAAEEKHAMSHRGRAVRALAAALEARGLGG